MGRLFKYFLVLLLLAFGGIQFVEVEKTNPPETSEIKVSPEVKIILKKSCYDCHSNQTKWPWYSKVAPVSWYVVDEVNAAREVLNFSEWDKYSSRTEKKKLNDIWKMVEKDSMPINSYTYFHPDAAMDFNKKAIIKKWITTNDFWR